MAGQRVRNRTRVITVPETAAVLNTPAAVVLNNEIALEGVRDATTENQGERDVPIEIVATDEDQGKDWSINPQFRYSLVRDVLRMNTLVKFDGVTNTYFDIDDWFEQFDAVIDDVSPSDKERVYMLKNLMKGAALTCLKVCQGQSYQSHKDVLTRKYRGPRYKWI